MKAEQTISQPVGQPVDLKPAPMPGSVTLKGRFGHIERLDPSRHGGELWKILRHDDSVWTYMFYGPFGSADDFSGFLKKIASLENHIYYAVCDRRGRPQGWASLMEIRPADRVIEVGSIVYGRGMQRTPLATEVQYLLARYIFETLGYRRYEWKCDALNARSRRAAERFGFSFEGIFHQHKIVKARNRDTAWFAMLDSEWPRAKAAFEQWLDPRNFDANGNQRCSLEEIRNSL